MLPRALLLTSLCALLLACGGGGTNGTDGGDTGNCLEPGKSPANIVQNYGFECGDGTGEWVPVYGDLTFPTGDAHTGNRSARLTATSSGGVRFAYKPDLVTNGGAATYCATVWAKGTVPYMRMVVLQDGGDMQRIEFNSPVTASWTRVPPSIALKAPNGNAQHLILTFEMQTNRGDGMNAKAGDTLDIDDVDVWQSADGRCQETR